MAKKKCKDEEEKIPQTLEERLATLRKITNGINQQAGQVVCGFIDDPEINERLTMKFIPTPNEDLNLVMGGGFPVGKITTVAGQYDSGRMVV